jgi:ribosome-associated toxin RatA of RatAB toxin-antitoxin module
VRHVEIHAFIRGVDAGTVFDTLADFRHYADLVDVVRSVEMDRPANGTAHSTWVVEFRSGLLQWTEQDWFRRDELRLDFNQTEGDFDEFSGGWVLVPEPDGVRTALIADFDFGVPSLASIVEPVAARVLTDVTQLILLGLFGDSVEFPAGSVIPARKAVAEV